MELKIKLKDLSIITDAGMGSEIALPDDLKEEVLVNEKKDVLVIIHNEDAVYNAYQEQYEGNKNNIGNTVKLTEDKRIYYFPKGEKVELEDVVELIVRESGTHRIKTKDGKLHIIPTGWLHIEIIDNMKKDWTV